MNKIKILYYSIYKYIFNILLFNFFLKKKKKGIMNFYKVIVKKK